MPFDENITRYPLTWPVGWKRTPRTDRKRSQFGYRGKAPTVFTALGQLQPELQRLGAREVIISTNLPVRKDDIPYSDRREPEDTGVAVYFLLNRKPRVLACDKWPTVGENLSAVAHHIESVRGQERWGVGTLEQAFRGYDALPAPKPGETWWEILGVERTAKSDVVENAYKKKRFAAHPDQNGSSEEFHRVQMAFADALAELEARGAREP